MTIEAIKTGVFKHGMNMLDFVLEHVGHQLSEGSLLAITSKVISVAEGCFVSRKVDKKTLIQKECEYYLGEMSHACHLTIHHGLLIPSAGIDESNSPNGDYILYPKDPWASARALRTAIRKHCGLKHFGLILTDSRTLPLRRGVVGTALAYDGFQGVKNCIGKQDIFGRPLKMTCINVIDALATGAVVLMGEGAECQPMALITDPPVVFVDTTDPSEIRIPVDEDLYAPFYKNAKK